MPDEIQRAMRSLLHFTTAGALFATARSSAITWRGPQATLVAMDVLGQEAARTTAAPVPELLRKRQVDREQTCGFLSGNLGTLSPSPPHKAIYFLLFLTLTRNQQTIP